MSASHSFRSVPFGLLLAALLATDASAQDGSLPPITVSPPAAKARPPRGSRSAARPKAAPLPAARPAARSPSPRLAVRSQPRSAVRSPPPRLAAIPPRPSPGPPSVPAPSQPAAPAPGAGSLTAPSVDAQKRQLAAIPGSVSLIDAASFQDRYTNNLPDILKDTPGILAQTRYGQEIRLSVRGSGLGRTFHLRGIELMQDGIPLNFADGSGDFYGVDPLSLRSLELYRGGNALAFGTTTLGGALNVVTPTARTALAPTIVRMEGGSFGALRTDVQASRVEGAADALVSATYSHQDGFRQHQDQDYLQLNGNVGYQIAPGIETRVYVGYAHTDQKLPGTLTLFQALTFPRQAGASVIAGNQKRDVETSRIANRTSVQLEIGQLDLDTWLIHKRLFHPIFQVIDQTGSTWGVAPRWTGRLDIGGFANDLLVGGRAVAGDNTARQYVNVQGRPGALTAYGLQSARNLEAFVDNRFWLSGNLALVAGAKWFHHERDFTNLFTVPNREGSRVYEGINPKVGLLYRATPDVQVFANLTRSRDVPDFTDLAQSNLSGLTFVPLEAQKAWTAEIGTRGSYDRFRWEATLYRSWLRDELLAFTPNGALGIPAATFNAPRTSRAGVELAGSVELLRDISGDGAGDMLSLSQIWTMTDARFVHDPVYGDNRIASQPLHVLRTSLAYRRPGGFFIAPVLDWVPIGAFADHANTLKVPAHALIGLQAGIELGRGVSVYLDARNLADKRYVSDIGAITDARRISTAVFYPGEGRAVFAGVRWAY